MKARQLSRTLLFLLLPDLQELQGKLLKDKLEYIEVRAGSTFECMCECVGGGVEGGENSTTSIRYSGRWYKQKLYSQLHTWGLCTVVTQKGEAACSPGRLCCEVWGSL